MTAGLERDEQRRAARLGAGLRDGRDFGVRPPEAFVPALADQPQFVIDDDGCGFDPVKVLTPQGQRGLGLAGIRERLLSWSGTMFIESNPGQGARIAMEIPLNGSQTAEVLETSSV